MGGGSLGSGAQAVLRRAREAPGSVAVVSGQIRITYDEMAEHLAKLATTLASRGVRPGMLVGLQCNDRYWLLALQLACEAVGATHVCLAPSELTLANQVARRCQSFVVERPEEDLSSLGAVVGLGREFLADVMRAPLAPGGLALLDASYGPDIGVRIARTSGTTGRPKLMLKTRAIVDAELKPRVESTISLSAAHNYISIYSTILASPYLEAIKMLRVGGSIYFISHWDELFSVGDESAISTLIVRDGEYLLKESLARSAKLSLAYLSVFGRFVSELLYGDLKKHISSVIFNSYSSNETGRIGYREAANVFSVLPDVGVEIVDEDGVVLPMGATGRIKVRSPPLVDGYLWDEELTAKQFRGGWFVMSDLGYIPEPGKLALLGRADDMIDIGGEKIAPGPIERALREVAGVEDAVLIRLENAYGVGVMCTVIERSRPEGDDDLIPAVLAKVARRGVRSIVHLEREFPRTETGKVQRGVLRDRMGRIYRDHLAARPAEPPISTLR